MQLEEKPNFKIIQAAISQYEFYQIVSQQSYLMIVILCVSPQPNH